MNTFFRVPLKEKQFKNIQLIQIFCMVSYQAKAPGEHRKYRWVTLMFQLHKKHHGCRHPLSPETLLPEVKGWFLDSSSHTVNQLPWWFWYYRQPADRILRNRRQASKGKSEKGRDILLKGKTKTTSSVLLLRIELHSDWDRVTTLFFLFKFLEIFNKSTYVPIPN